MQAEAAGSDPRRPQAGEHYAGGPPALPLQGQGHRLRLRITRVQGHVLHLPAVALLPVSARMDTPRTSQYKNVHSLSSVKSGLF